MKTDEPDTDVLIVGLGPVGAVMAALLALEGMKVLAIEAQPEIYPLPRAAHVDHEIMRVFQALGIIDAITPHIRAAPNYEFRSATGEALMQFEREGIASISGWPISFNIYQPGIEAAPRERIAAMPTVEAAYGTRFIAIASEDEAGVDAIIEGPGGQRTIRTRFIIGCDGAWSPVREACSLPLDDFAFDEPWLVLDAQVPDERPFPPMNLQICDPSRPTTFVHMGPGRLRWEFMLKPDEDADAMRHPERIEELLAPWRALGSLEIERTAVYRFHGLVARDWRRGRCFVAGDAAHQMPPFMGQGLCSGVRDAANLAWKLAHAIRSGSESLLATYQQERDPHVRFVVKRAIEMGRVVCTLDPDQAAERDARMLANPLRGVATIFPPIHGLTMATPGAGYLFPQSVDVDGGYLDDLLGPGGWLLHRSADRPVTGADLRVIATKALPGNHGAAVEAWLESHGAEAVLVRPDRYVFGTGDAMMLADAWRNQLTE